MKKIIVLTFCISLLGVNLIGCTNSKDNSTISSSESSSKIVESSEEIAEEDTATEATTSRKENETTTTSENKISKLVSEYSAEQLPDFVKNIQWTDDMIVNTYEELEEYFKKNTSELKTEIQIILSGSCPQLEEETLKYIEQQNVLGTQCQQVDLSTDEVKGVYALISVAYYPSAYIIDSYTTGDTSLLNVDNLTIYNKSKDYIDSVLDKNAPDIIKEKQIHDYICGLTTYYTNENDNYTIDNIPRYRTAVGVFLDGSANCMGYTDAFYMLGTMAGLDIDKVIGDESMKHTWNTIKLDNKIYLVDLTWNDDKLAFPNNKPALNNYMYFNASMDIITNEYRWDSNNEIMKDLVSTSDENYFYSRNSPDFGYLTTTYDEFYDKIQQLVDSRETSFYIASKNCNIAGDSSDMMNKIKERVIFEGQITGSLHNINGYNFAYIEYYPN